MIGLKSFLCCFLLFSLSLVEAGTQNFSVNSTQAYAPATITFDASGINQAKKYLWTFGDGGTLTTTNPVVNYQYKTAGKFTASLSFQVNASDKNPNYKDAGSVAITILAKQQQNLPPTASLSCSANNLLVNCNALASTDPQGKPLSFLFTYGDNFSESNTTGLSSHAFAAAGLYSVKLTVTNSSGLSSQATTQVQAVRPPNVFPSLVLNCTSDVINTLSCNANGSTDSDGNIVSYKYSWDDNTSDTKADSANITHVFSTSASHTVTLIAVDNDGGVSTLAKSFTVKANTLPVANFACDTSKPQKVTCTSSSTDADPEDSIQNYSWKFGTASAFSTTTSNTDYDFKTGGTFDVTLAVTDSYGGVGSVTKSITVKNNTPPVASFACTNTGLRTIHCASTSTDSDGSIASTSWALDDRASLTGTNFDHTFNDDQSHAITLTVVDDLGASTSLVQSVQPIQNQAPQLDISASTLTGVAPVAINFNANALDSDGVVSGINWSFSDGGSDFGTSVSHTFSSAGTYAVTATATDNLGATTTKLLSVTVNAPLIKIPPIAFFKVYEFDTWVELHSTLTKGQYDIKRAYYTIDGVSTVDVTEFYPNTINWIDLKTFGQHEIKLTVVDIYGQQSTFTQQVNQVEDLDTLAPFVDLKIQQSAARTVFLNFNRSFDYDIDQGIGSFHVDYGNGESEDTTNLYLTHVYPASGTYTITVTAYTIHGTQNTTSKQFTVNDSAPATILPPVVSFSYRIYDFAQNVSFYNDKSGTPNGTILSYVWDFGDGKTGTGQKVAHFYDPGSYFVTLTIVDSSGQSSSQTQHITIFGSGSGLVAQIGCDIAKPYFDLVQTCQVFALDKQNQITRVRVNWGDGTANNLTLPSANGIFRPTHKYANAGTYTVTETITTSRGELATSTTTLTLTKYNPIVANIQCDTNNLLVSCNALGTINTSGSVVIYSFDYGDGNIDKNSIGLSSHAYASAGLFTVTLNVVNAEGATSSSSTQVQVVKPANQLPVAQLNCTSDVPYTLKCNTTGSYDGDGTIISYKFNWDDNTSDTNAGGNEITHVFSNGGIHQVILSVVDNDGGVTSSTLSFGVLENHPPVANMICSNTGIHSISCISGSYDPDGGDQITQYIWDLGNGETLTTLVPYISYVYNQSSTYQITLQVKDSHGLTSSVTQSLTTIENLSPVADGYCSSYGPQSISCFSNSYDPDSNGPLIIEWSVDDKTSSATYFNTTLSSSGLKTVLLKVTDFYGAISTKEFPVTLIDNLPPIANADCSITEDSKILLCKSLSSDSDGSISKTKWTLNNGKIFNGSSFAYTLNGETSIDINMQVADNLGAISSFSKTIDLVANPPSQIASISDSCPVPSSLKDKDCSDEFFTASSQADLDDYLANGKFTSDGKLLNLEVANTLILSSSSISTSCQLKISGSLQANGGICIRGSSVNFSTNSQIVAGGKGAIIIVANDKIVFDQSKLKTEGDVSLLTSNFLPFDGQVGLINGSSIESSNLKIDTPSSIIEDSSSSFISDAIILNGGNCEISDTTYVGNCINNSVPLNLSIQQATDSLDEQTLNLNIIGADLESTQISWRIDNGLIENSNNLSKKFSMPGIYAAEAVILNSDGHFRKIQNSISVSSYPINQLQYVAFHFSGSSTASDKIIATTSSEQFELSKSEVDPEVYIGKFSSTISGRTALAVDAFDYTSDVDLLELPSIDDPQDYINKKFSELQLNLDQASLSDSSKSLASNLKMFTESIQSQISTLSSEDQMKVAKILQANVDNFSNIQSTYLKNYHGGKIKNSALYKGFDIMDLFIGKSYAGTSNLGRDLKIAGHAALFLGLATVTGVSIPIVVTTLNALIPMGKAAIIDPLLIPEFLGLAALTATELYLMIKSVDLMAANMGDIFNLMSNQASVELDTNIPSGVPVNGQMLASFAPLTKNIITESGYFNKIVSTVNTVNRSIGKLNASISTTNSFLSMFGLSQIPINLNPLVFSTGNFIDNLDSSFINFEILSPKDGSVTKSSILRNGIDFGFTLKSSITQNVILKFNYANNTLMKNMSVIKTVNVTAPPAPAIKIISGEALLDSNGIMQVSGSASINRTISLTAIDSEYVTGTPKTTFTWKIDHFDPDLIIPPPPGVQPDLQTGMIQLNGTGENQTLEVPYNNLTYSVTVTAVNASGVSSTLTRKFQVKTNNPPLLTLINSTCSVPTKYDTPPIIDYSFSFEDDSYYYPGSGTNYNSIQGDSLSFFPGSSTSFDVSRSDVYGSSSTLAVPTGCPKPMEPSISAGQPVCLQDINTNYCISMSFDVTDQYGRKSTISADAHHNMPENFSQYENKVVVDFGGNLTIYDCGCGGVPAGGE